MPLVFTSMTTAQGWICFSLIKWNYRKLQIYAYLYAFVSDNCIAEYDGNHFAVITLATKYFAFLVNFTPELCIKTYQGISITGLVHRAQSFLF